MVYYFLILTTEVFNIFDPNSELSRLGARPTAPNPGAATGPNSDSGIESLTKNILKNEICKKQKMYTLMVLV